MCLTRRVHPTLLFGYRWTRKGAPGEYTYEIYQDLRSQQEEEALRNRRRTLALRGLRSALSARLALADKPVEQLAREAAAHEAVVAPFERLPEERRALAALTPAGQAAGQAATRAYQLRELADPFRRALLRVPAGLSPEEWNALAAGETLRFSTRPRPGTRLLPPAVAAALRNAPPSLLPPGVRFGCASPEDQASFCSAEQQGAQAWAQADAIHITVRLSLPAGAGSAQAVLTVTPVARMAEGYAGPLPSTPALVVAGDSQQGAVGSRQGAVGRGEQEAESRELVSDLPPADCPLPTDTDPLLDARRPFKVSLSPAAPGEGEMGTLNQVLPQIAEVYGINLVADAYRAEPLPLPDLTAGGESAPGAPEAGTRPLYEVLNRLVAPTACWSRDGAFLQVRRRTWVHDRVAEIPARVAKAWDVHLRRSGRFSLDDAARLVLTLRDEQLASFEAVMREQGVTVSLPFETDEGEAARQQAILCAYGSLLPLQRQRLQAGGAVPVAAMPPTRGAGCAAPSQQATVRRWRPGLRERSTASSGSPGRLPARRMRATPPRPLPPPKRNRARRGRSRRPAPKMRGSTASSSASSLQGMGRQRFPRCFRRCIRSPLPKAAGRRARSRSRDDPTQGIVIDLSRPAADGGGALRPTRPGTPRPALTVSVRFTRRYPMVALYFRRLLWVLAVTALQVGAPSLARADEVLDWNAVLRRAVVTANTPAPAATRAMAIVHTAIFDALNGIDRHFTPIYVDAEAPRGASRRATVVQAAYTALVALYPAQAATLAVDLETSLARIAAEAVAGETSRSILRGRTWGARVAREILAAMHAQLVPGTDGSLS